MADVRSDQLFIEGICVWVVNVVVDTSLVMETSWLPKFLSIVVRVIKVEQILGSKSNKEESQEVSLESSIK